MNSLSEAMVCGVPMPVIPLVDQPVNAEQAALLGPDRVLKYNDITADSLKAAAFAVMEDGDIGENLRKVQKQNAAAPGNAGAVGIIEAYAQR